MFPTTTQCKDGFEFMSLNQILAQSQNDPFNSQLTTMQIMERQLKIVEPVKSLSLVPYSSPIGDLSPIIEEPEDKEMQSFFGQRDNSVEFEHKINGIKEQMRDLSVSMVNKEMEINPLTFNKKIPKEDLEDLNQSINFLSTSIFNLPQFPKLPTLFLPSLLSNTRINSYQKQIERVNLMLGSVKAILKWRYQKAVNDEGEKTNSVGAKQINELHQSIQYFQRYLEESDSNSIRETYLGGGELIKKALLEVYNARFDQADQKQVKRFFDTTIEEIQRLDSKFKSL